MRGRPGRLKARMFFRYPMTRRRADNVKYTDRHFGSRSICSLADPFSRDLSPPSSRWRQVSQDSSSCFPRCTGGALPLRLLPRACGVCCVPPAQMAGRRCSEATIDVNDREDSAATGFHQGTNSRHLRRVEPLPVRLCGLHTEVQPQNSISSNAALSWKHNIVVVLATSRREMVTMAISCITFGITASTHLVDIVPLNVKTRDIQDATKALNAFIGILLAFYSSKMLSRCWAMHRRPLIGGRGRPLRSHALALAWERVVPVSKARPSLLPPLVP